MFAEYLLLFAVMGILMLGRIVVDRIQDQQQWFCFYEQKKMNAPLPRRIMNRLELPVHYQAAFPQQEPLPFMVYIPGSSSVLSPRKEIFIVLHDDRLTLYEGNPLSAREISFDDILWLEHGRMLFSRWFKLICAQQTVMIPYYTGGEDAFARIIETIRVHTSQGKQPALSYNHDRHLNRLSHTPDTLMNTVKSSLLPGQHIVDTLFQPAYTLTKNICGRFLSITQIYTPHLSVMTEHELILIQKREPIRTIIYDQYSTKTLFIPYHHIHAVELIDDRKRAILRLKLSIDESLSLPLFFMIGNEQAQSFWGRLHETIQPVHPHS